MVASRRSQPGGLGKHAGRSMTRTMQRRNLKPRRILLAETGSRGWRLGDKTRKPGIAVPAQRDKGRGPTGVRSTSRMDSAAGKVGKVSQVAEALPHSEGAAYKRHCREIAACSRLADGGGVATMDRDNKTRTGAKDPRGRRAEGLPVSR